MSNESAKLRDHLEVQAEKLQSLIQESRNVNPTKLIQLQREILRSAQNPSTRRNTGEIPSTAENETDEKLSLPAETGTCYSRQLRIFCAKCSRSASASCMKLGHTADNYNDAFWWKAEPVSSSDVTDITESGLTRELNYFCTHAFSLDYSPHLRQFSNGTLMAFTSPVEQEPRKHCNQDVSEVEQEEESACEVEINFVADRQCELLITSKGCILEKKMKHTSISHSHLINDRVDRILSEGIMTKNIVTDSVIESEHQLKYEEGEQTHSLHMTTSIPNVSSISKRLFGSDGDQLTLLFSQAVILRQVTFTTRGKADQKIIEPVYVNFEPRVERIDTLTPGAQSIEEDEEEESKENFDNPTVSLESHHIRIYFVHNSKVIRSITSSVHSLEVAICRLVTTQQETAGEERIPLVDRGVALKVWYDREYGQLVKWKEYSNTSSTSRKVEDMTLIKKMKNKIVRFTTTSTRNAIAYKLISHKEASPYFTVVLRNRTVSETIEMPSLGSIFANIFPLAKRQGFDGSCVLKKAMALSFFVKYQNKITETCTGPTGASKQTFEVPSVIHFECKPYSLGLFSKPVAIAQIKKNFKFPDFADLYSVDAMEAGHLNVEYSVDLKQKLSAHYRDSGDAKEIVKYCLFATNGRMIAELEFKKQYVDKSRDGEKFLRHSLAEWTDPDVPSIEQTRFRETETSVTRTVEQIVELSNKVVIVVTVIEPNLFSIVCARIMLNSPGDLDQILQPARTRLPDRKFLQQLVASVGDKRNRERPLTSHFYHKDCCFCNNGCFVIEVHVKVELIGNLSSTPELLSEWKEIKVVQCICRRHPEAAIVMANHDSMAESAHFTRPGHRYDLVDLQIAYRLLVQESLRNPKCQFPRIRKRFKYRVQRQMNHGTKFLRTSLAFH